eukprot:gnl/Chilomastix_caulleri/4571.p1 GENE.gnl/Chilomastix_caulleri/4571~~gnl/Chilomastix_caulleri/4571.p1  ORF type:complete len:166 (-),score=40.32 gnl/Chilomastix_caulleri/4571:68-565(-)
MSTSTHTREEEGEGDLPITSLQLNNREHINAGSHTNKTEETKYIPVPVGGGVGRHSPFVTVHPEPTKKELWAEIKRLETDLSEANEIIEHLRLSQDEFKTRLWKGMERTREEERQGYAVQLNKMKFELRKIRGMIDSFARYSYAVVEANDLLDKRPCLFDIKENG